MSPALTASIIIGYFLILIAISFLTSGKADNDTFFKGNKSSSWYLVAFGMIGASLSGITFISVPGTVYQNGMTYMAIVLGYFLGYLVIVGILLPLYYKLNLTSIYSYLHQRFGRSSYKTGSLFFLFSRVIGASLRLYLVAEVLDVFLFRHIGLPYWLGIVITIALIWIYTFKGGLKTIIWTDTLQTAAMLTAVLVSFYFIKESLGHTFLETISSITQSKFSHVVHWKGGGWSDFSLGLVNGAFITIVMTGLDQDMMQKNLSCKNLKEAQKNMLWFSTVLIPVNLLFLALGVYLYEYCLQENLLMVEELQNKLQFSLWNNEHTAITEITTDRLFPSLAAGDYFPASVGIVFLIGLIAAAYSSADSALTSLTTAFCVDILEDEKNARSRKAVHLAISVLLILVILIFKEINDDSIIWKLFTWAGFTYGPLLGLFSFGLFTRFNVKDKWVPVIALISPILTYFIKENSSWLLGYEMGFEILPLNGALTFLGLFFIRTKNLSKNAMG